jgi:hypothetical protein
MARTSLHLDKGKLNAVGMKRAESLVRSATRRTLNRSQVLCPVDTGNLRASGQSNISTRGLRVTGEVIYTAQYAAAVHQGRRALTIKARRPGGKLKFTVGGRTVYASRVHQPARRGRPFLANALREVVAASPDFRLTIG